MRIEELDFDHHAAIYMALAPDGNQEAQQYFLHQAQHQHALAVHDAFRDTQVEAVQTSATLKNPDAIFYINHGVGRRAKMMWNSYREIIGRISPDRTEPLPQNEVSVITRDLNIIYINLRGVLDNYAWCLLHEVATLEKKDVRPTEIGLFHKKLMSDANLKGLQTQLNPLEDWEREVKDRRDPSAHRIPLSVPPSVLTPEEAKEYQALQEQALAAAAAQDFEESDRCHQRSEQLGTFLPYFLHHPDEPTIEIYPTVPQDLGKLVEVTRIVNAFLGQHGS